MNVPKLRPVAVPPHFVYYCVGCGNDFGTAERPAWQNPKGDGFQPCYCERCAAVENRRGA